MRLRPSNQSFKNFQNSTIQGMSADDDSTKNENKSLQIAREIFYRVKNVSQKHIDHLLKNASNLLYFGVSKF